MSGRASTRLHVLLARRSSRAVVLRRGPSKQVALIAWDRSTDRFEVGQWLKGHIYEHRCDLSPSGKLLVYFAASWRRGNRFGGSWTAVSKPPYLTALALWQKGDAWGGGGLFENEKRLELNHAPFQMKLAEGFQLPNGFEVIPFGKRSGGGEDGPIETRRDERDGWVELERGGWHERPYGSSPWIVADPPQTVARRCQAKKSTLEVRRLVRGIKERNGPWYLTDHQVHDAKTGTSLELPGTSWADWDATGELLFARGGKLFRLPLKNGPLSEETLQAAKELADFTDLTFRELAPPLDAREW